jgi:hypothetical protein
MEHITFDVHKRYTAVSVERLTGEIVRETRLGHQSRAAREFRAQWTPGSPVAVDSGQLVLAG